MCKISVIVPVYNAEDTLETALSSVFMQTLTDISTTAPQTIPQTF